MCDLLGIELDRNAQMGVYLALKELNDSIKWTDKELETIAKIKAQGATSEERHEKRLKERRLMKRLERIKMLARERHKGQI